jgi:hypothetical protein
MGKLIVIFGVAKIWKFFASEYFEAGQEDQQR